MTAGSISVQSNSLFVQGGGPVIAQAIDNASDGNDGHGTAIASANADMIASGNIDIDTDSDMSISGGINTQAFAGGNAASFGSNGSGNAQANSNARVIAGGTITIQAEDLEVSGGDSAVASACCNAQSDGSHGTGIATLNTNATLAAGGNLIVTVDDSVAIRGGASAVASANENAGSSGDGSGGTHGAGTATLNANASVFASGVVDIDAGLIRVYGGDGTASANDVANDGEDGFGAATMHVTGSLISGGDMVLSAISNFIDISGGEVSSVANGTGQNGGSDGFASATGVADAVVFSNGALTIFTQELNVGGGSVDAHANGTAETSSASASASANAHLLSLGSMQISVDGGEGECNIDVSAGSASAQAVSNSGSASALANANALIATGGDLSIDIVDGYLQIEGGGVSASTTAASIATANANSGVVSFGAPGTRTATIDGGGVHVNGGGASADGAGADASAFALLDPEFLVLNLTDDLEILGGEFGNDGGTVNVDAIVSAFGGISGTAGSLFMGGAQVISASGLSAGSTELLASDGNVGDAILGQSTLIGDGVGGIVFNTANGKSLDFYSRFDLPAGIFTILPSGLSDEVIQAVSFLVDEISNATDFELNPETLKVRKKDPKSKSCS